ncbi:MAG: glycosyltransferase [Deltaproteobacteria bacterium]|nr:glycosyltransferase [Deltaproteobacteria bacterium]
MGIAVVATRVGGVPEQVEDGVTGLLVPPSDPAALGEAIVSLIRDPERRRRMARAGRERALEVFGLEAYVARTRALYEELLGSSSDPEAQPRSTPDPEPSGLASHWPPGRVGSLERADA